MNTGASRRAAFLGRPCREALPVAVSCRVLARRDAGRACSLAWVRWLHGTRWRESAGVAVSFLCQPRLKESRDAERTTLLGFEFSETWVANERTNRVDAGGTLPERPGEVPSESTTRAPGHDRARPHIRERKESKRAKAKPFMNRKKSAPIACVDGARCIRGRIPIERSRG